MLKAYLRFIKQKLYFWIKSKTSGIKIEVHIDHQWYGNDYGGFYVNTSSLDDKSIIYSFGIGEDLSFDTAILNNHSCLVYGFDPTPKSIEWVNNQHLPKGFKFFPYGIDTKSGDVKFNLPKNAKNVSGSIIEQKNVDRNNAIVVPMKCLHEIAANLGHKNIDLLKMDIEGSEYAVLDSILNSNISINQILVELHERFFTDGGSKTKNLLRTMKSHGYLIFAISKSFEEISFIKCHAKK
jgi:FkbM family methyltransferase